MIYFKTALFFILIGFSLSFSPIQNKNKVEDLFYEVTIQSGASVYGTTSLKILYEGLLLRKINEDKKGRYKVKKELVEFKTVDSEKLINFFRFIKEKDIINFEGNNEKNSFYSPAIVIRVLDLNSEKYNVIKYDKFNSIIDELIILMNDLVPKEYANLYHTKRIKP